MNESHFSRRPSCEAPNSVRDSCNSQPIARTERLSRPTVRIAERTDALTHPENSLQTPLVQQLMRLRHLVLQCSQARLVEEEWSNRQHQETLFVMQGVRIPPPIRPKVHPPGPAASLGPTARPFFCFAGLVCVVGRRNDGVERKARVGAAGSVASGVGERSGTRFGLKRDAEVAVRTHRSHRGYRRAKIRGGGNQGVAGSRRWRTACSGHRA